MFHGNHYGNRGQLPAFNPAPQGLTQQSMMAAEMQRAAAAQGATASLLPAANLRAKAALMSTAAPVSQIKFRQVQAKPKAFQSKRALFAQKIARKKAKGSLKSALGISRDLQREGRVPANTEGATQLLLQKIRNRQVRGAAIPAILRRPDARQYSILRPKAIAASRRLPKGIQKQIAILKKMARLKRLKAFGKAQAVAAGQDNNASLIESQLADMQAQIAALQAQIVTNATITGVAEDADVAMEAAELEAVLETEAEVASAVSDEDLMAAAEENADMQIMDDIEMGEYFEEAASVADDAGAVIVVEEEVAPKKDKGIATLATPRNLIVLAAAAGLGYVLFLRD